MNSQGPAFRRKMSNREQYQHPKILSTKFVDLVFRTPYTNGNSLEANQSKFTSAQEDRNGKTKSIESSKLAESGTKPQDGSFEFSFSKKLNSGLGSIRNSQRSSNRVSGIGSKLDTIRNSIDPIVQ